VFVRVAPSKIARTPAEFAAGLKSTVAAYQRAAGRLPLVIPLPKSGMSGLGASANAGTYSDPNCPFSCFVLGNGLDMAVLGSECAPCHNICPTGTVWDTTNLVCSSTPAAVNPMTPVSAAGSSDATDTSCPGYCGWIPLASTLFPECQPCSGNVSSTSGLAIAGIALAAVVAVGYLFGGKR
jgi:hypothetical protein